MKQVFISICVIIFVATTAIVLGSNDSKKVKRVRFTNENIVIQNTNTEIEQKDIYVSGQKINTSDVGLKVSDLDLNVNNQNNISNQTTTSGIEGLTFRTQNTSVNNQKTKYDIDLENYNKQRNRLDEIEQRMKSPRPRRNINTNFDNQNNEPGTNNIRPQEINFEQQERWMDKNIDWNTWKSNFINQILDDTVYIKALDSYGLGTWFYYDGSISDIKVMSIYLDPEDKAKIVQLIRGYAHKSIAKFPANTKRKTAKVDAVMLLGSREKRANPSDFNENESVRIKY